MLRCLQNYRRLMMNVAALFTLGKRVLIRMTGLEIVLTY